MFVTLACLLAALLLAGFLFRASYDIGSGVYLKAFCRKETRQKVVALTFDDGPDSVQTPRVLQVLKEEQVPACFFCIGSKVAGNEALIERMVADGHLIGNHSWSHSRMFPLYSLRRMKGELQACQSALEKVTLQPVNLFRPPFGVTNPTVAKAVRQLGYRTIGWNIRTFDTQHPSPERVLRRIRKRLRPGSIILLHDRMPGSDALLKQVIGLLKKEGYTVVRPDELN